MNPFKSISDAYKRWRHSYGYGVHSPYAYDLIKTVVTPGKYSYYGYADIDREILKPSTAVYATLRKDARFLLRLLVYLRANELLLPPKASPVFATAATAAGIPGKRVLRTRRAEDSEPNSGKRVLRTRHSFLLLTAPPASGTATQHISSGNPILAFDPSPQLRDEIKTAMTDGLILEGTRSLLAIPRTEMALTHYSIRM